MKRIMSLLLVLALTLAIPFSAQASTEYSIPDTVTSKLYSPISTRWSDLKDGNDRALYAACILTDAEAGLAAYGFRADKIHTITMHSLSGLIIVDMYQGSACWSFMHGNGLHVTYTANSPWASDPTEHIINMYMAGYYDDAALISDEFLAAAQQKLSTLLVTSDVGAAELFRKADKVGRYRSGFANFERQEMAGFVSPDGVYLYDESWNYVYPFNECGYAVVYNGPYKYGYPSGGKYGIINSNGELVVPMEYGACTVCDDGVISLPQGTRNFFFVSETEEVVSIPGVDYVGWRYSHGLIPVFNGTLTAEGKPDQGLWGCATLDGEIVVPLEWEYIGSVYTDNMISCKRNGLYGVIDRQGKEIIPCEYTSVQGINGYITAETETTIYLFDDTGKLLHSKSITPDTYAGLAGEGGYIYTDVASDANTAILWRPDGTMVMQGWYDYTILPGGVVRVIRVTSDGKELHGLYDLGTGAVISPALWEDITYINYNNGSNLPILKVKRNGKYGFILSDGTPVTDVIYDDATNMEFGYAVVKLNGTWQFIDEKGNTVY